MSGTLKIQDDVTWMPASWAFDEILDRIAAELIASEPSLATALREAMSDHGGYGDLRELSDEQFHPLLAAARLSFSTVVWAGPQRYGEPEYYQGFMAAFAELKALLRADPRSGEPVRTGRLLLSDMASWTAPSWAFDLVLERMATAVQADHRALTTLLMSRRTEGNTLPCDLRSLDASRFRQLLPTVDWLYQRYGDGQGRSAVAPVLLSTLAARLVELHDLFHADARADGASE